MYILPGALAPLAAYRQFIVVEFTQKVNKLTGEPIPGKSNKYPINTDDLDNIHTKGRHDAHDPSIWMTCEQAAHLTATLPVRDGSIGWGVGFVITRGDPFGCMDMDGCTTPDGSDWMPEAYTMLGALPGANELSISCSGLHKWFKYKGEPPEHGKRSSALRGSQWLELYTELRFIALGSSCDGAIEDVTALLPTFIDQYFPPVEMLDDEGWRDGPCEGYTPLSDDELISKALARVRPINPATVLSGARPFPSFADLWTNDVEALKLCFPTNEPGKVYAASEVDHALAKELAYWTGRDHTRIEKLMMQSGLVRDKWGTRRKHQTYLQQTICNGVAACTQVYHVKPLAPMAARAGVVAGEKLKPRAIETDPFCGREEMAELFDGCVYIQDLNSILLPNGDIVDQARFKAKFAGYSFMMGVGCKPSKDAWDAFINNQCVAFPRVEGTTFQPGMGFQDVVERAGRCWVNVYKAPVVDRRPGDVTRFMELLHKILPKGDDAIILLSYMAAVVQYPGVKFRWAPFVQGTQGNGKSTLIECLKYALGRKYIFSVKAKMVTNDFNAWTEHNVLYIADDIYTTADRNDIMEALKSLITDRDQPITLKGIDSIQKEICGNFIFTDNHKDAMKKTDDSRRLCTLYSAQQSKRDRVRDGLTKAFFAGPGGFVPWLESGGYAFVAEMLYTMEIDPRYNPAGECQEAPDTSATQEAIIDGRTGVEHEVSEWIELGEEGFCGDFVSYEMLKRRLSATPQFSRSASPLKVKEMMGRLGYEMHRGLRQGRTETEVAPDDKRVILYVKCDSPMSDLDDPIVIATLYSDAQQAARAASVAKMFKH